MGAKNHKIKRMIDIIKLVIIEIGEYKQTNKIIGLL